MRATDVQSLMENLLADDDLKVNAATALSQITGKRHPLVPQGYGGPVSRIRGGMATLPKYDHIVIIFEENKDYGQVIGSSNAPYINNTLLGTYHAVSFTQDVRRAASEPAELPGLLLRLEPGGQRQPPVRSAANDETRNLGTALLAKGYTFKGYAEDLPSVGYTGATHSYTGKDDYVLKHCPWVNWQQSGAGTQANSIPANLNVPFCTASDNRGNFASSFYFPTDYSQLPTLSLVIPNEMNEMHSGSSVAAEVRAGDSWLHTYLDGYAQWAITHNSLLIVTWDEDGSTGQAQNQLIPTILVGARLNGGDYRETLNHYNLLRSLRTCTACLFAHATTPTQLPSRTCSPCPRLRPAPWRPTARPKPAPHASPVTASAMRLRGHRRPRCVRSGSFAPEE